MKNKKQINSIIAMCLILTMNLGAANVWAQPPEIQTSENRRTEYRLQASSSNGDEIIEEEDNNGYIEIATDSIANRKMVTDPVPYETMTLAGRMFSTIISMDETLNYHVIKYTVPAGKGGYYTLYGKSIDDGDVPSYRYICNEEQYENLCHGIELLGNPSYVSIPSESLAYEYYSALTYQLEEGDTYYFISSWWNGSEGDYNVIVTSEFDVILDPSDATDAGTPALYSKGSEWCVSSSRKSYEERDRIVCPTKTGYRFAGYFTAKNGLGTQVIDHVGDFLPAMNELEKDCTIYAFWEKFAPISIEEIKLEGRRFSKTIAGDKSPYYAVFKFTVPAGGSGTYSFYDAGKRGQIIASGYVCTSDQYEAVCHKIEQKRSWVWVPGGCLVYDSFRFAIKYNLEEGKDYYFIATRYDNTSDGDFRVIFERDITVMLEATDAIYSGTAAIYSKGGQWIEPGGSGLGLRVIDRPAKTGLKFAGYFTGKNGQGTKVIDIDGEILESLGVLDRDATIYAHWEEYSPVQYEEILLTNGKFSTTGRAEDAPYYKALRFKVPEDGGGYYSLYIRYGKSASMNGYLCKPSQYEELCRMIEGYGYSSSQVRSRADYIAGGHSSFIDLTYKLEGGQEYFFVTTKYSKDESVYDEYKLWLRRDIDVELDAVEADRQGTSIIYSMGEAWSFKEERDCDTYQIGIPRRAGYMFAGYFTEAGGQGNRVIDCNGFIDTVKMHDLSENTTVYAYWDDKIPEFKTDRLMDGTKNRLYKQKIIVDSYMDFFWDVEGELPEGLYVDYLNGWVFGYPTEIGTYTFTIVASNLQIRLVKEFSITINEPTGSDDREEHSGSWFSDENGRWRYYTSGSNYCSNEWKQLEYSGEYRWYYFGSDGYACTGWIVDNTGKWYYLNPVSDGTKGAMQTGWLTDTQDGNRYYLDPKSGQMQTGWVRIDEVWYYFNEVVSTASGWSRDDETASWRFQNLGQKPLGVLEAERKRTD